MIFPFFKNKVNIGFTLVEALIVLFIAGVVSAIVFPILSNYNPNADIAMYKKAVFNVSSAFSNATKDPEVLLCKSNWKNCSYVDLCEKLADKLSTVGIISCSSTNLSSYSNPNFVTSDGIKYWGLEGDFSNDTKTIYVDRELKSTENKTEFLSKHRDSYHTTPGFKIVLDSTGGILYPNTDDYNLEKNILSIEKLF